MKKKIIGIIAAAALMMAILCSCQNITKEFGGTSELDLDAGQKLLLITWKDESLWYLTRDMREGESAEDYHYIQSSNFGIIEGEVNIHEHNIE